MHCDVAIVLECHYEKFQRMKKGWKTAFFFYVIVILYWEKCLNPVKYSGEISVVASKYIGVI